MATLPIAAGAPGSSLYGMTSETATLKVEGLNHGGFRRSVIEAVKTNFVPKIKISFVARVLSTNHLIGHI